MSWDSWTDNLAGNGAHHCAIFGHDGNPWSCKNVSATPDEVKLIINTIKNQKQDIFGTGCTFNGEKWTAIVLDDNVLVLKGKEHKEKTMTVRLTKQAIVFGCNKDAGVQANQIRKATETLGEQLEATGY